MVYLKALKRSSAGGMVEFLEVPQALLTDVYGVDFLFCFDFQIKILPQQLHVDRVKSNLNQAWGEYRYHAQIVSLLSREKKGNQRAK